MRPFGPRPVMRVAPLLALLATCCVNALALLRAPTISPSFIPDVDANDFLTFTLNTAALDEHAFSVNITDLHAISPSNYTVYWVRMNPASPDLPKPPNPADADHSLIYMYGDLGATHTVRAPFSCCVVSTATNAMPNMPQTNGLLAVADAIVRGDEFYLEVGIRVSRAIDVNATLLVPHLLIEYWTGPSRSGVRKEATVALQPSVSRKQPAITSTVKSENTTLAPAGSDPLPVQAGERIVYTATVTLPQGKLTDASLVVDLRAWLMGSVAVTSLTASSPLLTSSCGAFHTAVRQLATLGPDPARPTQIILPLCTLTNNNTQHGETESLNVTIVAYVRVDDEVASFRGTLGSSLLRLISNSYDGGFKSIPSYLLLAVTGFNNLIVAPKTVHGVLPNDVVTFTLPFTHLSTSNAPAYRVRLLDVNFLKFPFYNITHAYINDVPVNLTHARLPANSSDTHYNGSVGVMSLLPQQGPLTLKLTVKFSYRAAKGGITVLSPDLRVEWWSHPTLGRGKHYTAPVSPGYRPVIETTPQLGHRVLNAANATTTILSVIDGRKHAFAFALTGIYPSCVFVDFDPLDGDGMCASQNPLYHVLGVAPSKLLTCFPYRVVVTPTGCLQLDPTPPPVAPSITLTTLTSPEYYNRFPDTHNVVATYRTVPGSAATPPCGSSQSYDASSGSHTMHVCSYGAYGHLGLYVDPSATPTPSPLHSRSVVPGGPNAVGTGMLVSGILFFLASATVVYCAWFERVKEEWPLVEFIEFVKARRGDKAASQRRMRKQRWREKGLSIRVMEEKLRQKKLERDEERRQAEADRLVAERLARRQEEEAAAAAARAAKPVNDKLLTLQRQFEEARQRQQTDNNDTANCPADGGGGGDSVGGDGAGSSSSMWAFMSSPARSVGQNSPGNGSLATPALPISPAASRLYSTAP